MGNVLGVATGKTRIYVEIIYMHEFYYNYVNVEVV